MIKVFFPPTLIPIQFNKVELQNVILVFIPGKKDVSMFMGNAFTKCIFWTQTCLQVTSCNTSFALLVSSPLLSNSTAKLPYVLLPHYQIFLASQIFDYLYFTDIVNLTLLSFPLSCILLIMLVLFFFLSFFSCRLLTTISYSQGFLFCFVLLLFAWSFVWLVWVLLFVLGFCLFIRFFLNSVLAAFCLCTVS